MLTKKQLQPPFRQQDLLGLSDFIRHCKNRGVDTSEKQLEYYEKEGLLLPTVRVNHGFVKHKRIDGQTYYEYGCVAKMGNDWLGKYEKRGLVEYPAETEFREWSAYRGVRPQTSRYFAEKPLPMYETFYSKWQIFPLKEIQDWLVIHVRDGQLFADDDDWVQMGRRMRRWFSGMPQALQGGVLRYYETFSLLHSILDLLEMRRSEADLAYKLAIKEYQRSELVQENELGKRASEAAWDRIDEQDALEMPGKARVILRKTELSLKEIEKRRREFAYLGFTVDPTNGSYICLDNAIQKTLVASSRQFKFVEECYTIAEQLGWFLRMVGEHPPSLEEIQSGIDRLKICVVCGIYFKPVRRSDRTCRNERCIILHRNKLKAEWKRRSRKTEQ